MKVLFLTYFYYDIYKPILQEMERQGHIVTLIEDKSIRFDYNSNRLGDFQKRIRKFLWIISMAEKRYWKRALKEHPELDGYYDVLLCMPGFSFCKYLLDILRKNNPDIKSCALINDSSNYYNHYKNKSLYDKIYTFDYHDANKIEGVKVLDAYWESLPPKTNNKYQVALIGSDHDDRLDIIKKIYPQLVDNNISYYIRVVSKKPAMSESFIRKIIEVLKIKLLHHPNQVNVWEDKMKLPFVTDKAIPVEDVREIINSSECILETDREGQSGLTLRDMWALASGKKIITTNLFLKELPYFNEKQIKFIDRKNPIIDIDFIKKSQEFPMCDAIKDQRIDHWVRRLLLFD